MDEVSKYVHDFIQKYFYYLEYPNSVADGFWKSQDGKLQSIMSMNKEEVKESIRRVETDLYRFEGVVLEEAQQKALGILFPMAQNLLHSLMEELQYQEQEEDEARNKNIVQFQKELEREKKKIVKPPAGPKKKSVTLRLSQEMYDRISAEGGNFEDVVEAYLRKGGLFEDGAGEEEKSRGEERKPDLKPAQEQPVKLSPGSRVVQNSVDSILRFTRLALSYDFSKQILVNYIRLIERTALRIDQEIQKQK